VSESTPVGHASSALIGRVIWLYGFFAIDDGTPLHPWAGLLKRIICVVWFTLLIVLAIRLRRVMR
jgi:hypothetical protein